MNIYAHAHARTHTQTHTLTCTSLVGVGISGVRAAELNHEVGDGAVHMHSIVEAGLDEVDEVGSSNGHLVGKNLDDD